MIEINPRNNAQLKVGDEVICTSPVTFIDSHTHNRGDTFIVSPETQAYFSLFTSNTSKPWANYLQINK